MKKQSNKTSYPGKQKNKKTYDKVFKTLPALLPHFTEGSQLTSSDLETLEKDFGERVKKALEIVAAHKVRKYLFMPSMIIRWVVVGSEKDYLVLKNSFCSCKDFLFNTLLRKNTPACYHLLAQELAERTGNIEIIELADELYNQKMAEWLEE